MAKCRDVAKAANVSVATVSYVFTPGKRDLISPETRERVLAVAADLGYKPSPIGRSLSNRKTYKIGLLFSRHCQNSISTNQLHILHSLSQEFASTEYDLSIFFGWDEKVKNRIKNRALDGIILSGYLNLNSVPDQIAELGMAMVVVNRRYRSAPNIGVVDTDYVNDARMLVRRFAAQGKKRIFSITRKNPYSSDGNEIRKGIMLECETLGLQEIFVSGIDWLRETDYSDAGFIMFAQHLPDEAQFNAVVEARPDAREIWNSTIVFSDQVEHRVMGEWRVPNARQLGKETWNMMQSLLNNEGSEGGIQLVPSLTMDEYRKLLPPAVSHDF
jgi:DNA-binding LacI/PurR family transcriptional regulator